ncbi:hypothetical protein KU6B_22520 [Mameliella alba]|uniref:Uncharacterized protein n=1 Tax=Mameliella alba TaxID=561184 RepID=A0A0B3RZQ6_9RHOB|nr:MULTISPECIES: hypothetical protein [Mameliella]KHQ52228.1 hypothetical protein OA50_03245 [Mameliella alba]MCR9274455.1 hypothetical protein [Paracoccaceae bacterium]OWV63063.1 hypothetical protein CDZ98_02520 [Mameliella alba]BBU55987.1 hypothetical protein KU6B_22520 [Mameliella alba]
MALTDFNASHALGSTFSLPRLPEGLLRRIGGCVLALVAYLMWIAPMGLGAPILVPFKLGLSCLMLSAALGMSLRLRGEDG